jgi:hypothetical protein
MSQVRTEPSSDDFAQITALNPAQTNSQEHRMMCLAHLAENFVHDASLRRFARVLAKIWLSRDATAFLASVEAPTEVVHQLG